MSALRAVRSERQLCERLDHDLPFRFCLDGDLDDEGWDPSVFSKNRDRLPKRDVARSFRHVARGFSRPATPFFTPMLRDYHRAADFSSSFPGRTSRRALGAEEHMAEWWVDLFDERYFQFYEMLAEPVTADEDATFVERALDLRPGSTVLDLGCGQGRHSVALASRGHTVTGLDLSSFLLDRARALAAARDVNVTWVQRDMRDIGDLGPFDACVSMHTAFGYFSDEEDLQVVRRVAEVLRPGGRLLLDLDNPFPLLRRMPISRWRESARQVTKEHVVFDPLESRRDTERTSYPRSGGRVDVPSSSVRTYFPHEVRKMLRQVGLQPEGLFGALGDEAYDWARSHRMIWTAVRPTGDH